MRQDRLNDAAIALSRVLSTNSIKHGIFGGCAVAALGGPCEAKDIDCLVASDKQRVLDLLGGKGDFQAVSQASEGFVAFSWDDGSGGQPVDVELSLGEFPHRACIAARSVTTRDTVSPGAMQSTVPKVFQVRGAMLGAGPVSSLDEVHIFKGKLRAAAVRAKASDAPDLTYLESAFRDKLCTGASQFSRYHAGLALLRYPGLVQVIQRVGVDVEAAAEEVKGISLGALPLPQPGDVQKSLLE
ncbi:MAG: hypothetical protein M1839_003985 [Geoglossum umbratile]|nr:MAG: hypothetical protein M1839_003985 [Geoglossum umbratile]